MLRRELPHIAPGWEIIVVDDGGRDFRDGEWNDDRRVTLLRFPVNRGKGAAVKAGLLAARGSVRIFTDVDVPFGVSAFAPMVELLLGRRFHVVIGDRTLPESSYALHVPLARRAASSVFSRFVGTLVTGGFFDTQCGLKALRGDVADALCPCLRIDRFAFDVELLYVALRHKLDVKRVPVTLQQNDTSSVRLVRDSLRSVWDVLGIKVRQLRGFYSISQLHDIARRDYEAVGDGIREAGLERLEGSRWA